MSFDFYAVGSNLAGRFAPWNVTPPSGENNIVLSTADLPDSVNQEPTVLITPPEPGAVEFRYYPSGRSGEVVYGGRLYLWKIRDNARNVALAYKWLNALYAQLDGQVHLALADPVQYAVIRNMGVARLEYGGQSFDGLVWDCEVHLGEALNLAG